MIGSTLYVVGGWQLQGDATTQWHDTALSVDLSQDKLTWKPIAQPPFHRRALALAEHNGKLYCIGGMQEDGGPTTKTAVYDPATDVWTKGPSLGIARKGHTASVTPDGRIWVVGGLGAGRSPLDPREWLPGEKTHGSLDSVETLATRAAP